jgi:zeaxanthin glucosyltransferase
MAHFGIFCPPGKGHIHTMLSIVRKLQRSGHKFTYFQVADLEAYVTSTCPGVKFCRIGEETFPLGELQKSWQPGSKLSGIAALRFAAQRYPRYAEVFLREGCEAVAKSQVDMLLVDQVEVHGGSIAERLGIPFVSVASALPLNAEAGVPPCIVGWPYSHSSWAKARNIAAYRYLAWLTAPSRKLVNKYRVRWGLKPLPLEWTRREEAYSELAQISQLPACLDFPRKKLPRNFYPTGFIMEESTRGDIPFPWERLDGRPLIYASLGTEMNRQAEVFRIIAKACDGLKAQLVISLGRGQLEEAELGPLLGNPIVVEYAPQDRLLKKTSVLITHGSLNTTLEAARYGVPMVIVPFAYDQPGVASRMAWHGIGEGMPLKRLSVRRLRESVIRVWNEPKYREKAQYFKTQLGARKGVDLACEVIERTLVRQGENGRIIARGAL